MTFSHVSLFAGVGGADLGMEAADIDTVLACEIDKNARGVLAHRFPHAELWDDVRSLDGDRIRRTGAVPERTILSGGFPCQPFSVAGRRGGMGGEDERGDLYWEISRILAEFPARWIVLENVPGLLSIDDGRTFGTILGDLAELGYGVAYRVLDAQHFGVPQRRRRVFIVGCLGDDRRPVQVLLEPESRGGNLDAGVEEGTPTPGPTRGGAHDAVYGQSGFGRYSDGVTTLTASGFKRAGADNVVVGRLLANGSDRHAADAQAGLLVPYVKGKLASTDEDDETWRNDEVAPTLNVFDNNSEARATVLGVIPAAVRRLTPRECERLMGWPDDHTRIRSNFQGDNIEQADSHRYKQCGNGMASPVVEWIARRIVEVDR